MSKSRAYAFTHNNYADTVLQDQIDCQYIVYGKEIGEGGTPHLQGLVYFKNPRSMKGVIKALPGCHVEIARNLHAAIEYCKKDGQVTERGVPPMTPKQKGISEQNRWKRTREAAELGDFDAIDDQLRITQARNLEYIHLKALSRKHYEDTDATMLWYWGPSGTGKSRTAREENPTAFIKGCNKWWDGYNGEDVVIIEDFDAKHDVLGHHLKIWADRYPFPAEVKGGSMKIRPKQIIVTSNYAITDIWTDANTKEPLKRRFKEIHFGTTPFVKPPSLLLNP